MSANETQVGGAHYGPGTGSFQHWDFMHESRLDWCGGNATKYVSRWWAKGGAVDLGKAKHYLQKRDEQGIWARLGAAPMPYDTAVAMAAFRKWVDGGSCPAPEYEQGIIAQIILGNNAQAVVLINKLLDHEVEAAASAMSQTSSGRDSIKQSHRAEGRNFIG